MLGSRKSMRKVTLGYGPLPAPVGQDDGVLQIGIRHRNAVDGHHQKMDLVNVKGVNLAGIDSPSSSPLPRQCW